MGPKKFECVSIFLSLVLISLVGLSSSLFLPVNLKQYCPLARNSDFIGSGPRVINVDEASGRKVKIQFFYPSPSRSLERLLGSMEATTLPDSVTNTVNSGILADDDYGAGISTTLDDLAHTTAQPLALEEAPQLDVYCQWNFKAGNDSQFLLLTFDKLSAPYSVNCEEAYVAMQKENGYESRWCGNRRQPNARPMALFSRAGAKLTVSRSATAPQFPPTGFSVVVEAIDISTVETNNNLRVLLG